MKTKNIITIMAGSLLFAGATVQAYPHWDIYSDAQINEGDGYGIVNIYDTLPDRTTVSMLGGYVDYITTHDSSTLNVLGGNVQAEASDYSVINITGGNLSGAEASDYAVVNFSGDAISRGLGASGFGIANMYGGTVEGVGANDSGVLNLYGGTIADSLGASRSGTVNIYGYGFYYDPVGGAYDGGQLTGFWFDDTPFTIDLYRVETYSHINLIPEPATLLLLGLGGLFLRKRQ